MTYPTHPVEEQTAAFYALHPGAQSKPIGFEIYGSESCVRVTLRASDKEFFDKGYDWKKEGFPSRAEFVQTAAIHMHGKGFSTPIIPKKPSLLERILPNIDDDLW